jgi:phi13 family phage major tail protein
MAITRKKPPVKYTVGAQYICFNVMSSEGEWTEGFEADVIKLPTIVDVEVSDNADSYDTYASGDIYDSATDISFKEISETNIAFPHSLIARLRGDTVDDGVIVSGGRRQRPFFAYGFPIVNKDGTMQMRWFPKCKLSENSDSTETSEESHKDQNDTVNIKAYTFNDDFDIDIGIDTSTEAVAGITEDAFFAAPLLTIEAVKALIPIPPTP